MKRTALAFVFTLIAVSVPCTFWYVIGSRDVQRQADEIRAEPRRVAQETAESLAERIEQSIRTLVESESRRPFYHYQDLYHDPQGAYEGRAVVPSPLSQGSYDPLVAAYFRMDANGRISMPNLSDVMPQINHRESVAERKKILTELQTAKGLLTEAAPAKPVTEAPKPPPPPPAAPSMAADPRKYGMPEEGRNVEVLDPKAWQQNDEAAKVYQEIKEKKPASAAPAKDGKPVVITVEPFHFFTIPLGGIPRLVALRRVVTPAGTSIQGFLVSETGLRDQLRASPLPARIAPGLPGEHGESVVRADGAVWHVSVDDMQATMAAEERARSLERRFLIFFTTVALVVGLAGLAVVGLVWQAEHLAVERSRFAASAAHELKTPLTSLRIYSGMLAENLGDPRSYPDYARQISEQVERLGRVVANVLEFTRLERGTLSAQPKPGNLRPIVEEAAGLLRPVLEAGGAALEVNIAEDLPDVPFDSDSVFHIIQNLLDNAEKHTRAKSDRRIRLDLKQTHDGVILSVTDNGPGIAPVDRLRLFHPFARGSSANLPAGLGLGLTMVKALAEAQNARVVYEDAPAGGAIFKIIFPIKPASQPSPVCK
jgi:signal transduction histidine kinase